MRILEVQATSTGARVIVKMEGNKYTYYKVIQGNYGYGWDDEDFHECDSSYRPLDRNLLHTNLKAYQENGGGCYRVVKRRELNTTYQQRAAI